MVAAAQCAARGQAFGLGLLPGLLCRWTRDSLAGNADGTQIGSWADTKSGLALTQATAANKPTWAAAGGPDGLGALAFNGTSQRLAATYGAAVAQPATYLMVAKMADDATTRIFFDGIDSTHRHLLELLSTHTYSAFAGNSQTMGPSDSNWHVFAFVVNGVSSSGQQDRVNTAMSAGGLGAQTALGITVGSRFDGGANFCNGQVAEIIVCSGVLSADVLNKAILALAVKYGITIGEGLVYYVDSAGADTNSGGVAARPFLTVANAITQLAGAGPATIKVKAAAAAPLRDAAVTSALAAYTASKPLSIVSQTPGTKWYAHCSTKITAGWALVSGSTYSQTIANLPSGGLTVVVATDLTDGDGNLVKLQPNTTTPTTPAAGEFGVSGAVVFVQLPDGTSPNTHTIELGFHNYGILVYGTGKVFVRDGKIRFGNATNVQVGFGTGIASQLTIQDTDADYGGSQNFFCLGTGGAGIVELDATNGNADNCITNDGWSAHGDPGVKNVVRLTNCSGSYNGVGSPGALGQAYTCHDDCIMYITGGRGHHNVDSGMKSVNNAEVHMDSVEIDHNYWGRSSPPNSEGGICFQASTTTGTVTNCNPHDNAQVAGIFTRLGSAVTVDAASQTNSGTVHGNGLADKIQAA